MSFITKIILGICFVVIAGCIVGGILYLNLLITRIEDWWHQRKRRLLICHPTRECDHCHHPADDIQ